MTQSNNWGLFQLGDQPIDVASLKGKTIGIYNDSWTAAMLPLVLESGGLTMDDVKTVAASGSVIPLLLNGKIDVATEVTNLGGVEITTSGGGPFTQLLAPDAGAPDTPVWVYVASSEWASSNPDLATAWLEATRKGIEWASENPEDAVALFEETYPEAATDNGYNLEAWKATIPLLTVSGSYPAQTDEEWSSFTQALIDGGQLDSALPPSDYYTNAYAPSLRGCRCVASGSPSGSSCSLLRRAPARRAARPHPPRSRRPVSEAWWTSVATSWTGGAWGAGARRWCSRPGTTAVAPRRSSSSYRGLPR
jgi:putative hydroxymethylpyrimidine transport system substrate-binding protein